MTELLAAAMAVQVAIRAHINDHRVVAIQPAAKACQQIVPPRARSRRATSITSPRRARLVLQPRHHHWYSLAEGAVRHRVKKRPLPISAATSPRPDQVHLVLVSAARQPTSITLSRPLPQIGASLGVQMRVHFRMTRQSRGERLGRRGRVPHAIRLARARFLADLFRADWCSSGRTRKPSRRRICRSSVRMLVDLPRYWSECHCRKSR